MATFVRFAAPKQVQIVSYSPVRPGAGEVAIETLFSGVSAGTELTGYRGTNPYLNRTWVPQVRLFRREGSSIDYPLDAQGYEEVGRVTAVGSGGDQDLLGRIVWGDWGHQSHCVRAADWARERLMPDGLPDMLGIFAKIGGIGLNAVLDSDIHVGETVVIFGAGIPGQIAAQLARLNGGRVVVVDPDPTRRRLAGELGAWLTLDPVHDDVAERIRRETSDRGADVVVELSGSYVALQEALRTVAYNSRVVVGGFYQGDGDVLRLGEEFHHNRVQIVGSQISGVAPALQHRWDELRLSRTVLDLACDGRIELARLITHTVRAVDAAAAFRQIDESTDGMLQVVLDYTAASS